MDSSLKYLATVCAECQRASLVVHRAELPLECGRCGAPCQLVPNAEYLPEEVALFDALGQVVERAALTASASALIAAELEAVSERWESPELLLARVTPKLPGLRCCYSPSQNYAQLVVVVSTLLIMVGARLQTAVPLAKKRWRESGVRPAYRLPPDGPHLSPPTKRNTG